MLTTDQARTLVETWLTNHHDLFGQKIVTVDEAEWGWRVATSASPGRISFESGYVYLTTDGTTFFSPVPVALDEAGQPVPPSGLF